MAKPPVKRRRPAPEDRRAAIVEAAFAVFRDSGFTAARMEDVARRAGVAKGTVYLYFTDKQALFEAVIGAMILPRVDHVEAVVQAAAVPAEERLRGLIRFVYDQLVDSERREVVRMVIAESARFPAIAAFYHREVIVRARAALTALVAQGIAEGTFADGPVARQPIILIGPALMAMTWRLVFEPIEALDRAAFLEAHEALILHGLMKAPAAT